MDAAYEIFDPSFADMIDTDRAPECIGEGMTWTEGPVWMGDRLYFNDIPAKRMMMWREGQGVSTALSNSEFANGNTRDMQGRMISCEHGGRRVIRRLSPEDASGVEVIADSYQGKRLNSPNDVVVRSDGSVWFTDPPYGINSDIEGYPAESEIGGCYVFCAGPDGTLTAVATDFDKPNGLAFSPDETQLYIADSGAIRGASFPGIDYERPHHIRVFDVKGTALSNGRVFAEITPGVPDGLRIDHGGILWTSAMDGVHCLDQAGHCLGKIRLPAQTSNLCFGGASGMEMFITSSGMVWRVQTTRTDAAHAFLHLANNPEGAL
ncbi:SMP-30/gluconolactonase/LRE family protein [Roseobacter sp. YSTF-M11]|uniref:SMP-30/gluconolactonase/LRE family protein n=1 Tax=Roseobacter insulae TaxID=2859783 RepID=A0A9X1FTF8_9RHOB|nr:SMP-30/gluconolactonase/LRE family protein [Roseobacter insulae]MBW4706795.1 SMP-30/gluconolactonase/LRE family protein [Roseobacter insulae]